VLTKNASSLTVGLLLESLQLAVEYEAHMAKKFNVPVSRRSVYQGFKYGLLTSITVLGTSCDVAFLHTKCARADIERIRTLFGHFCGRTRQVGLSRGLDAESTSE
jgi:hypothetical protein